MTKPIAPVSLAFVALLVALARPSCAETLVDDAALADEAQGKNWLAYGRTYSERRFSPLDQINADNVAKLGLAWSLPLPKDRSLLSTPIVVDGVLFFTGSYSVTRAVDAKSGKLLWEYDPKSIEHAGDRLRVMWDSSRGLGYWKRTVVIATIDGRLIALDAKTGKERWTTQTTDVTKPVYISGYPKVFRGKVIVGNGGTEFGASRGYVSAYDVATGRLAWKFYIVPGNPADGFEDETQAMAAKTWTGEWWKHGGGGNTWNGITYDPEYNQILLGTGNGSPWNRKVRSPGGGDNLFLCSIVALDADSGKYKWHYQTVPGESWDYNSSMDIVLADLTIGGKARKVLLHAPKNGFFYVIDRADGQLLSAEPIAKVTWAERIDIKTGRPVEVKGARYEDGEATVSPSPFGAHNWHAMSYSPKTGLVYIPKIELAGRFNDKGVNVVSWRSPEFATDPAVDAGFGNDIPLDAGESALLAWDPVKQKKVWEVPEPGIWNPGTMVTAGNLVFQGRVDGEFAAYHAENGKKLWSVNVGSGISAPPVTYEIDGKQYVSLLVGWGGAGVSVAGGSLNAQYGWAYRAQTRKLLTFVLGGKKSMPYAEPRMWPAPIIPADFDIDDARADRGRELYVSHCVICHGSGAVSGGGAPDLRASQIVLQPAAMKSVVIEGAKIPMGMPRFRELGEADLDALRHYVRRQARDTAKALEQK